MKVITIAVALCVLLPLASALAAETGSAPGGVAQATSGADGMQIAEELLLQNDTETLPAKEEKVEQKKRAVRENEEPGEAPLLGGEVKSEDVGEASAAPSPARAAGLESLSDDGAEGEPKSTAGSLEYEMSTIDMLADAPAAEKAPGEAAAVAKR